MDDGPHHAGDIDNITADAQGVAHVNMHVPGLTLGTGAANDVAGRAIIVHADADDYHSQPSGNAGKRLACGVIKLAD
jgi:Cu-Zn family superoxide dismutase